MFCGHLRYEGCMLIVKDVQKSTKFYVDVLKISTELELPGHVVFSGGFFLLSEKDWLSFAGLHSDNVAYAGLSSELVFETDDIEGFASHLAKIKGIHLIHGIKEHPWGRRAVRFFDLDRHVVEVGESMRVVVTRFLRQGMSVEEAAEKSEFPLSFAFSCKAELDALRSAPCGTISPSVKG